MKWDQEQASHHFFTRLQSRRSFQTGQTGSTSRPFSHCPGFSLDGASLVPLPRPPSEAAYPLSFFTPSCFLHRLFIICNHLIYLLLVIFFFFGLFLTLKSKLHEGRRLVSFYIAVFPTAPVTLQATNTYLHNKFKWDSTTTLLDVSQ